MIIPHSIKARTTAELREEIDRISASTDPTGPLFGRGGHAYASALKMLNAELAARPAPAPAAAPAPAPVLPDTERRELARALASAGKGREQIASALGADRAAVDAWLDGPDTDASDDTGQADANLGDPRHRVAALQEQIRRQVAGGSYKTN